MPIDLRSDLLARPTEPMLEAMLAAGRQSRSYGHREGATVQAFQRAIATLLGMEDALLFPTCTMANQAALMTYCQRGETVLVDANAHLNLNEASSTIGIAGVIMRHFVSDRGHPIPHELNRMLTEQSASLIWLENTHNRAGGTIMAKSHMADVTDVARKYGTPVHVDGARLWNASIASGSSPADLVVGANSVAVSLNKCLGVPVGAVLAGSRSFIQKASEKQLMLGGGWRSTDMIAAAGLEATTSFPTATLQKDHEIARLLAGRLSQSPLLEVDTSLVETNIVHARPRNGDIQGLIKRLKDCGILVTPAGKAIRFVVYWDIREEDVERITSVVEGLGGELCGNRSARIL